jgi:hypothetical protein
MGGYTYKPQYGVVVICASEEEQKMIYERLKEMGLNLKVVCV